MATHLTAEDFARAATALAVDVATIRAVAEVEASGAAFLPDGRPTVLYEPHIFHRETAGRFANEVDRNGLRLSSEQWNRALYGPSGAAQHDRIADAAKLDWEAAHKAASWGMYQILGLNHAAAGHPTIRVFVDAMHSGASASLRVRCLCPRKPPG